MGASCIMEDLLHMKLLHSVRFVSLSSKCGKYLAKTGAGYEMILPTPKAAPKSLDTGGFFGPNFPRVSALFYAYNPAFVFARQRSRRL